MTVFPEDEDSPFDVLGTKIYDKLGDIADEVHCLRALVDKLVALGIPAAERKNIERQLHQAFGDMRPFSTLEIWEACYTAVDAAKAEVSLPRL